MNIVNYCFVLFFGFFDKTALKWDSLSYQAIKLFKFEKYKTTAIALQLVSYQYTKLTEG